MATLSVMIVGKRASRLCNLALYGLSERADFVSQITHNDRVLLILASGTLQFLARILKRDSRTFQFKCLPLT